MVRDFFVPHCWNMHIIIKEIKYHTILIQYYILQLPHPFGFDKNSNESPQRIDLKSGLAQEYFEKKSFEWLILNSSNLRNGLSEICMWSKRIGLGLNRGVCHQRGGETSSCGKGGGGS